VPLFKFGLKIFLTVDPWDTIGTIISIGIRPTHTLGTTKAFSQNIGKAFLELKLVTENSPF